MYVDLYTSTIQLYVVAKHAKQLTYYTLYASQQTFIMQLKVNSIKIRLRHCRINQRHTHTHKHYIIRMLTAHIGLVPYPLK